MVRVSPFIALGVAGASLGACSHMAELKPEQGQTLDVRGDARRVTVTARWAGLDPYPAAEKHCARFGRIPSFGRVDQNSTTFDCVDPAVRP